MGAETLRYASVRASGGYPPVGKSPVALTQGNMNDLATESAFIPGQSPCLYVGVPQSAVFLHKSFGTQAWSSAQADREEIL